MNLHLPILLLHQILKFYEKTRENQKKRNNYGLSHYLKEFVGAKTHHWNCHIMTNLAIAILLPLNECDLFYIEKGTVVGHVQMSTAVNFGK